VRHPAAWRVDWRNLRLERPAVMAAARIRARGRPSVSHPDRLIARGRYPCPFSWREIHLLCCSNQIGALRRPLSAKPPGAGTHGIGSVRRPRRPWMRECHPLICRHPVGPGGELVLTRSAHAVLRPGRTECRACAASGDHNRGGDSARRGNERPCSPCNSVARPGQREILRS